MIVFRVEYTYFVDGFSNVSINNHYLLVIIVLFYLILFLDFS
jgi:hypothetical protein